MDDSVLLGENVNIGKLSILAYLLRGSNISANKPLCIVALMSLFFVDALLMSNSKYMNMKW